MIVTIDGPAGSGKSTVARALAARENLTYLDTGAMYRAVTWATLDRGFAADDAEAAAKIADECVIEFAPAEEGQRVIFDGVDVTEAIRTPEVDANVSANSAIPAVRDAMGKRQKAIAAAGDIVCEGRDMGTVVFPNAEVKVFLTADAEARARRRAVQRAGGDAAKDSNAQADEGSVQEILEAMKKRDALDSSRETAPLKPAEDAHMIDSSALGVEEVCDAISDLIAEARKSADAGKGDAEGRPSAATDSAANVEDEPKPSKKARAKKGLEPMKFVGNSYEDYYAHPMREFPRHAKLVMGAIVGLVGGLSKVVFPWTLEGADELAEATRDKGAVLVMNHGSMLDPVIPVVALYVRGRRVRPIYKSEFDKVPLLKWAFARIGAFPIKRGTADMKAMRWATSALEAGESVLIYPEGTRIKRDEDEGKAHGGFALIAQRANADVIPIAIVGARDITPKGKRIPKPSRVFARVGEALKLDEIAGSRKERVAKIEELAMQRVYELRNALRADHPGKM